MTETIDTANNALEVVKTIEFSAPPERVWKAITDPEELAQWFPNEAAEVDVKPGAEGRWVWEKYGGFAVRFDVVEAPTRLVWTWARDADTPLDQTVNTTVEWNLEARPDGGTTLHLRETGFARPEDHQENDTGWDAELGELVTYLEG